MMDIVRKLEEEGFEPAMLDELVLNAAIDLADQANETGMTEQVEFLKYTAGLNGEEIMREASKTLSLPGSIVRGVISLGVSGDVLKALEASFDVYKRSDVGDEFFLDAVSFDAEAGEALAKVLGMPDQAEHLTGRYILFYLDE